MEVSATTRIDCSFNEYEMQNILFALAYAFCKCGESGNAQACENIHDDLVESLLKEGINTSAW